MDMNLSISDSLLNASDISWDSARYGRTINFTRGTVALMAIVLNLLVIYVIATGRKSLHTKINWAICNFMLSNALMCSMLATHSFIKFAHPHAPLDTGRCLALTWFVVVFSFGPTWGVILLTALRLLSFKKYGVTSDNIKVTHMLAIRMCVLALDVCLASFIIYDVANLKGVPLTRCIYQAMLDKSLVYVLYNFVLGLALIVNGLLLLIMRAQEGRRGLSTIKPDGKSVPPLKQPYNYPSAPVQLWKKPKYLMLFAVLAVLFVLPRAAFLVQQWKLFWQLATLCPALIALMFAVIFSTIPKDIRMAVRHKLCCHNGNRMVYLKHQTDGFKGYNGAERPSVVDQNHVTNLPVSKLKVSSTRY